MFRIFGPPGTGKTTTLLNMVDKALAEGTPPERIAFLAFTRKAANEARERAAERFNLDPRKDLIFFRTLHSMALTMSDIRPEQVMQEANYLELGGAIGVELGSQRNTAIEEDVPSMVASSDPILGLINLARLRKVELRKQYNESGIEEDWNIVQFVDKCLRDYKDKMGLFDFTDMLQHFAEGGSKFCPKFDLCFLDEAQDLAPLQWDIAHLLDQNSKKMYCAGDDDQAIYRWAGADVEHFINLPGGSETLSQSYRIPKRVHEVAERVVRRITSRFPKVYLPKDEPGNVRRITGLENLDMGSGDWLILAQARYLLAPVAQDLKSNGYLFNDGGKRSISEKISDAVNGWERLRQGRQIEGKVARIIYSYMSTGLRVARGFKKLPSVPDEALVFFDQLTTDHGLRTPKDMIWSEALDKLPELDRAYVTALLRRGEKFNGKPRITTSTIHSAKGGEAENVVLLTDLSPAADTQFQHSPNDTHRLFYVAVTRAKKNLYVVDAEDTSRSYDL